ncbi:NUDIX hydrolase [Clostridium sp.]|uniref:NUDIX hydrolase n=1 Tax=Clostridium sp. TaxID=1506 RepID=UPI003F2F40C8
MHTYIGCSIIIYNKENEVLISQRSSTKKTYPLLWEVLGGAVEAGESPDECIRREIQEEISCEIQGIKLFKVYIVEEENNRHILIVYTGTIEAIPNPNKEIQLLKWIGKDEINQYAFMGNDKQKVLDFWSDLNS